MHREEWDELTNCIDCGTPVDVGRERGYQSEGGWALCWDCALARGARFDENEDRWTVQPDVVGLAAEDDHKVR